MSKEKLLKCLRRLKKSDDTENAHWEADEALLEFIDDADIMIAYKAIAKWYA